MPCSYHCAVQQPRGSLSRFIGVVTSGLKKREKTNGKALNRICEWVPLQYAIPAPPEMASLGKKAQVWPVPLAPSRTCALSGTALPSAVRSQRSLPTSSALLSWGHRLLSLSTGRVGCEAGAAWVAHAQISRGRETPDVLASILIQRARCLCSGGGRGLKKGRVQLISCLVRANIQSALVEVRVAKKVFVRD